MITYIKLFLVILILGMASNAHLFSKTNLKVPSPAKLNLVVDCLQVSPTSGVNESDGVAGVYVNGGTAPFTISWKIGTEEPSIEVGCLGWITIPDLPAGTYTFKVQDANGTNEACTTTIYVGAPEEVNCPDFNASPCRETLISFLQNSYNPNACKQWDSELCGTDNHISHMGKVGIGISDVPSSFSLAVKGGILTEEIIVELCETGAWCDYVFEEDYDLMPLSEVRTFIDCNGHLPGFPSQKQITRDEGFELKAIKLKQQEKIEEAYLHVITLNEKINLLEDKIAQLRKENERLQSNKN